METLPNKKTIEQREKDNINLSFSVECGYRYNLEKDGYDLFVYEINGHNSGILGNNTRMDADGFPLSEEYVNNANDAIHNIIIISQDFPFQIRMELERIIKDKEHAGYGNWREKYLHYFGKETILMIDNEMAKLIGYSIFKNSHNNPFYIELLSRDKILAEHSGVIPAENRIPIRDDDKKYPSGKAWIIKPRYGLQSYGVKVRNESYVRLHPELKETHIIQEFFPSKGTFRIHLDLSINKGVKNTDYFFTNLGQQKNILDKLYTYMTRDYNGLTLSRVSIDDSLARAGRELAEKIADNLIAYNQKMEDEIKLEK